MADHIPSTTEPEPSSRRSVRLSHGLLAVACILLVWQVAARVAGTSGATTRRRAPALSVVDMRGRRVELSAPPQRIVSLTPANTEILYALGLGPRIVAVTGYSDYPPAALRLPTVGDSTVSIERVLAQRPDLVVASASANQQWLGALDRAHVRVFAVDPHTLAETYAAIRGIGAITGRTGQAEQVVRTMERRVAEVARVVARDHARPRVLFVVTANPLWVAGTNNFIDDLIRLAGGINIAADTGPGYHPYSPESVVVRRPDVVLVDRVDAPRVRTRPGWGSLPAVRRGAIYSPDPDRVNRPGPRLADALVEIARLLHPRAFGQSR